MTNHEFAGDVAADPGLGPRPRSPYTFRPMASAEDWSDTPTNRPMPRNWEESVVFTVCLAGARASGKSLYIGVLFKMLAQLGERFDVLPRPADDITAHNYSTHYEQPLFEEMGVPESTPAMATGDAYQREPLIYSLGRWKRPGDNQDRPVYLVIRDVAGEDLERLPEDRQSLGFFEYADQVIFLFDPDSVPEIRSLLRGYTQTDEPPTDAFDVLDHTLELMGDSQRQAETRLAVTISKFDMLRRLAEVDKSNSELSQIMANKGAAFNRQTEPMYSANDPQLIHEETRSLLLRLGAQRLVTLLYENRAQDERTTRFFAVSSLGKESQGSFVQKSGITPFRCLDPILWLLYDHGIMTGPAER